MDIRIGVTYSMKEIELEVEDSTDRDELRSRIDATLADESGVLWLTDKRGREVAVPAAKVAYVELGRQAEQRNIGFSA